MGTQEERWAAEYGRMARQGQSSKRPMKYLLVFGVILIAAGIGLRSVFILFTGGILAITGGVFLAFQGFVEGQSVGQRNEPRMDTTGPRPPRGP